MSPNEFSPEILSQGKYSINYGDLAILMTDTGYFTLGELNNLAADANIRVTSLDGSGAGKTYKVIFVTPMGSQNEDYKIFTVKKKSITVTATSAELVYKAGAILSCNDASITKGSLVDGHTYSYYCDGFIDCSKPLRDGYVVTNAISNYQIFDKEGNDVSFNYDIKYEQGLLTLVKQ